MPYRYLMKSIGKLLDAMSYTRKIDPQRSAEANVYYSKELISGYNHSSRYRKWDVCWIQWGNNLEPEMSYKHMGVIFKVDNKQVYAFPITTFNIANHQIANAYHPIDNPCGNKMYYKIKPSEYSFLFHDSVIKLTELKVLSVKRIISKCGTLAAFVSIRNDITDIILDYLFHEKNNEIKRINKESSLLKLKLELKNIPDEVLNKNDIVVDPRYSLIIDEVSSDKLELKLTDSYGQSETKIISVKQIKQD